MNQYLKIWIVLISAVAVFGSCQHDPVIPPGSGNGNGGGGGNENPDTTDTDPEPCDPNTVYFEQNILPLIVSSCAIPGCHDPNTAEDGVILNNYQNIFQTGDIEPFDPQSSDLYEVITEDDPDKLMPPPGDYPALTADEISLIQQWILQGAQNNSCTNAECDTTGVTYNMTIEPIISAKCGGCHSGANPQGGISLTSYAEVSSEALFGVLLDAVQHNPGVTPMPYNSNQLPQCEIDQIRIWIENGAPE